MTVGEMLMVALRLMGVDAVFGVPFDGVRVVGVSDGAIAEVLALAHQQVHRRVALVHAGDGRFVRPSASPDEEVVTLRSVDELWDLCSQAMTGRVPGTIRLELDPHAPVGANSWPVAPDSAGWDESTNPAGELVRASQTVVVLAGPGVVDCGAQAGLHALAAAASVGVLNTWGAKGLFDWRSRHHLATVGLQEQDFELGGLAQADLIVATGLDPFEAPDERWRIAPAVVVSPDALGPMSETLGRPRREIPETPLRTRLGSVTQKGWIRESAPLPPTRVTRQYALSLGASGLVSADAGVAGYWVARTFSTTRLGTTVVPNTPTPGFAVAAVIVARMAQPWRPALAVVNGTPDAITLGLLDEAARMGIGVGVEAWDGAGPALDGAAHMDRLRRLIVTRTQDVVGLSTDGGQIDEMIEAAGPIIAWRGATTLPVA
jgi:thiamine pyrophosphate-dependent acetolactate synthase large subunit-like protein